MSIKRGVLAQIIGTRLPAKMIPLLLYQIAEIQSLASQHGLQIPSSGFAVTLVRNLSLSQTDVASFTVRPLLRSCSLIISRSFKRFVRFQ
jgi:hypothetical protein